MNIPKSCGCLVYPPGAAHSNCDAEEITTVLLENLRRIAKLPGGVLARPCADCPAISDEQCPCPSSEEWYNL